MTYELKLTFDNVTNLSSDELSILDELLNAGDRGAFHYVYASLAEVDDALLSARSESY